MIKKLYWFTGQAGAGKTTLALALKSKLAKLEPTRKIVILDGDEIRELFNNQDYSKEGRVNNVEMVQNCCRFLAKNDITIIVCMVSPFAEQRMKLCKELDGVEVFVKCDSERGREHFHVDYFEEPIADFSYNHITMNTTFLEPNQAIEELWKKLS
jgi:adenylylsulfate kinase